MDWFSSRAACQSSDDWEATQHTESVVTMLFPLNDSPYQRIYGIMKKKPICVALEGETIEALDERAKVEDRSRSWLVERLVRAGLQATSQATVSLPLTGRKDQSQTMNKAEQVQRILS